MSGTKKGGTGILGPVFQDTTWALVRQLNPVGDLIPLNSLIDAACFQLFCLVWRKRKCILFWETQYVKTDFSLWAVLEPETKLSAGGKCQNSLDTQKLSIMNDPENLGKRKLKKPEPLFLQKLGENLYVVTEAMETLKEATLEEGGKAGGGISIPLLTAVGLKGNLFNTTITLPLGAILAFHLKQPVIGENSWGSSVPDPAPREHTGFRALQAEVEDELPALKSLTLPAAAERPTKGTTAPGTGRVRYAASKAELGGDGNITRGGVDPALDLDEPVAPGVLGHPPTPPPALETALTWLQETSGKLNPMLAGNVLCLLGPLQELSEEQQQLLAMSVEKGILPRQMKPMETILDQNFLQEEAGTFHLHSELLAGFWGEELKVTRLLGLCYPDIQGDGPLYTWDPSALPPLCALSTALSIFWVLANNTWLSSHFVHQESPALPQSGLRKAEWDLETGLGKLVKMESIFGSKLPLEVKL
ncbi:LOW QUALITY PROTEIN: gasdermin-A-like [Dugong dugon]